MISKSAGRRWWSTLTNDALPEVVGLALGGLVAGELPVNLVLDVGHRDECSNNTAPAAGLD